jgi:LacI family transcriptional regulator
MLAVSDQNVADALRVIRNHAIEPLSISDILRRVPVGRHALQRAFRKHVGRTMLDEIHRVRVERAKSILATTDLAMPQVAQASGFTSSARLAKVFHRETGTTPGSYRRAFRNL